MTLFHSQTTNRWALLVLAGLALTGCASSSSSGANPLEGTPGVLGSMAQARSTPEEAARRKQSEETSGMVHAQSAQAALESDAARAALKSAEDAYAHSDWVSAAQQFKRLTATYPNNGQLWFGYGAASALSGNLDEAASGFDTALRIDGNDARAAYNLSLVRLSQADIALNRANQGMDRAPVAVREEIMRLRKDLAPLFGRNANAMMDTSVRPGNSPIRVQDPARVSGDSAARSTLPISQERQGAAATP